MTIYLLLTLLMMPVDLHYEVRALFKGGLMSGEGRGVMPDVSTEEGVSAERMGRPSRNSNLLELRNWDQGGR